MADFTWLMMLKFHKNDIGFQKMDTNVHTTELSKHSCQSASMIWWFLNDTLLRWMCVCKRDCSVLISCRIWEGQRKWGRPSLFTVDKMWDRYSLVCWFHPIISNLMFSINTKIGGLLFVGSTKACAEIGNNIGLKCCCGIASQHRHGRTKVYPWIWAPRSSLWLAGGCVLLTFICHVKKDKSQNAWALSYS